MIMGATLITKFYTVLSPYLDSDLLVDPTSSFFGYLLSDGSDLDTVSHGSLDSANDSAERTSIDTDFTKMDSSDDGFSTGRELQRCFIMSLLLLTSLDVVLVEVGFIKTNLKVDKPYDFIRHSC